MPKTEPKTCVHKWIVDEEDRRFKWCGKCMKIKYRTDEELLREVQNERKRDKAKQTRCF